MCSLFEFKGGVVGVDGWEKVLSDIEEADDDDLLCELKPEPDEQADKRRFSSLALKSLTFASLFFLDEVPRCECWLWEWWCSDEAILEAGKLLMISREASVIFIVGDGMSARLFAVFFCLILAIIIEFY